MRPDEGFWVLPAAINGEAVAEWVVAALVGSIGPIASMPITTALAALSAPRTSGRQLASSRGHGHRVSATLPARC